MFLDKTGTIIINAVLTTRGRQLLSKGQDQFKIVKFGLSDSQIDYGLWDASKSTDQKGSLIQDLPIMQALPYSQELLTSMLVTMPKGTTRLYQMSIPGISSGGTVVLTFKSTTQPLEYQITPTTTVIEQNYAFTIHPNTCIDRIIYTNISGVQTIVNIDMMQESITVNGKSFKIITRSYTNIPNLRSLPVIVKGLSSGALQNFTVSFNTTYVITPNL